MPVDDLAGFDGLGTEDKFSEVDNHGLSENVGKAAPFQLLQHHVHQ